MNKEKEAVFAWTAVIFLDWVNLGSPWWSRSLTGLDPVDLIG
jgi:hypothetical protein